MSGGEENFGLVIGGEYIHSQFLSWGVGIIFYDVAGRLKIDFERGGSKSIINKSAAQKLILVPDGYRYINRPVLLEDGQLVVILDARVSEDRRAIYKVFRDVAPRVISVKSRTVEPAAKSQGTLKLMNEWFKFKNNLPLTTHAIRMAKSQHREAHCYSCKQPDLDNHIDYECGRCIWIICPACGACGCGYKGY